MLREYARGLDIELGAGHVPVRSNWPTEKSSMGRRPEFAALRIPRQIFARAGSNASPMPLPDNAQRRKQKTVIVTSFES